MKVGKKIFKDRIKTAVFPVAGLGTRFLPITRSVSKEFLPIIDKPLIHYAVEEALVSGIETLIFVTGKNRFALKSYFGKNLKVHHFMKGGRFSIEFSDAEMSFAKKVECHYVKQSSPKGLGDAILCAKPLIGDKAFVVILPDDVITGPNLPTKQLIDSYYKHRTNYLLVKKVSDSDISRYGIIDPDFKREIALRVIEKPNKKDAPSNLASLGRYVLEPTIFSILETLRPGKNSEIQLADALNSLAMRGSMKFKTLESQHFDCGSKFGYLEAVFNFSLSDKLYGKKFQNLITTKIEESNS